MIIARHSCTKVNSAVTCDSDCIIIEGARGDERFEQFRTKIRSHSGFVSENDHYPCIK